MVSACVSSCDCFPLLSFSINSIFDLRALLYGILGGGGCCYGAADGQGVCLQNLRLAIGAQFVKAEQHGRLALLGMCMYNSGHVCVLYMVANASIIYTYMRLTSQALRMTWKSYETSTNKAFGNHHLSLHCLPSLTLTPSPTRLTILTLPLSPTSPTLTPSP